MKRYQKRDLEALKQDNPRNGVKFGIKRRFFAAGIGIKKWKIFFRQKMKPEKWRKIWHQFSKGSFMAKKRDVKYKNGEESGIIFEI